MSYHDSNGKEISIHKLVRLEPDWAASIIPNLNKEIETKSQQLKLKTGIIGGMESRIESLHSDYKIQTKCIADQHDQLEAKDKVINELELCQTMTELNFDGYVEMKQAEVAELKQTLFEASEHMFENTLLQERINELTKGLIK